MISALLGKQVVRKRMEFDSPAFRLKHADVAQLEEQLSCKQQAVGSRPTFSFNTTMRR